jgi:hypothetical protein
VEHVECTHGYANAKRFWWEHMRVKDCLEDLVVYGQIKLKLEKEMQV